ncbi:MAG: TPM domain-containing protein [Planctomycetes bacterium]|nr:TPM domain-containing protein [Planctomycetota bacterium]
MNTLLTAVLVLAAPFSPDDVKYPARPGPREFILDEAKLIKPDEAAEIRILCDEVLTKKKAPIVVVTIPSLAAYGAGGWPIERYALNLMSEWGVGYEDWNYGMLLLVSPGDKKARIELGGSWARRKDEDAKRVMTERIIPKFKQGDYSKGILEGTRGLYQIALDAVPSRGAAPRVNTPPAAPRAPPQAPQSGTFAFGGWRVILIIIVGIVVVMVISRMLRGGGVSSWGSRGPYGGGYYGGGGGFGSSFGGGLLGGALGSMIGNSLSRHTDSSTPSAPPPSSSFGGDSSSSGSDSSDFGGGSFGGGFSGGGGATGEW